MATVRIEVELDGRGAIAGLKDVTDKLGGMPKATGAATAAAKTLREEQTRAAQAAQVLANRLGVQLPEAAGRFLAQSKAMGGILNTVFSATMIGAVAGAVIQLVASLDSVIDRMGDWSGAMKRNKEFLDDYTDGLKKQREAIDDLKRAQELIGKEGVNRLATEGAQIEAQIAKLERRIKDLRAIIPSEEAKGQPSVFAFLGPQLAFSWQTDQQKAAEANAKKLKTELAGASAEAAKLRIEGDGAVKTFASENMKAALDNLATFRQRIGGLKVGQMQGAQKIYGQLDLDLAALDRQLAERKKTGSLTQEEIRLAEVYRKQIIENAEVELARNRAKEDAELTNIDLIQERIDAEKRAGAETAKYRGEEFALLERLKENNKALIAGQYDGAKRIQVELGIELETLEEIKNKYSHNAEIVAQVEINKSNAIRKANFEIAKDTKEKFERMAEHIESFFDRVFLTARSFSDVWRQLWTQSVGFVVKQFARMVAAWYMGHQQMAAIGSGGSGVAGGSLGGAAALGLSGVMSGGWGGSGGGGGSYGGGGVMADPYYGSIPILTGIGGGGVAGSTGTGGVRAGSMGSGFAGIGLGATIAGLAGMQIAGYGVSRGNVALGGLGGFLTGGAIGTVIAGTSLGSTAIGAFAGPIGAGIGAVIGIILAMRAKGRQKNASAQVHEQYLSAQKKILDEYERHRTSYDSAVGSLGTAYQAAVQALQGMGSPGRNTISEIGPKYQAALARLDQLQKQRDYRVQTISGLPVPSFDTGSYGILSTGSGGGFLAQLHPGEAVLNRRAAARLGDRGIASLNSGGGGSGGGSGITINIQAADAKSFVGMLKDNRGEFLRLIRQAARDAGLQAPV